MTRARTAALPLALAACTAAPAPAPPPAAPAPAPAPAPDSAPPRLELLSAPTPVLEISSPYSEVRLAVSPDGNTLLWGSANRPGGPGSYDLWISQRPAAGAAWSAPAPVPFDTAAKEYDPAFSPDGRFVYFFSDRPGGLGGDDLYRVPVLPGGFGPVQHLGDAVNSAGAEWAPAPMPDGSLLFCSNGRGAPGPREQGISGGRQDLYLARPRGDGFLPAEPLPGAINTPGDDFDATPLPGGGIVYSRTPRIETDPVELAFSSLGPDGYRAGIALPAPANTPGGWTFAPSVDARDPEVLYYTQRTATSAPGTHEIYRVRYRVTR